MCRIRVVIYFGCMVALETVDAQRPTYLNWRWRGGSVWRSMFGIMCFFMRLLTGVLMYPACVLFLCFSGGLYCFFDYVDLLWLFGVYAGRLCFPFANIIGEVPSKSFEGLWNTLKYMMGADPFYMLQKWANHIILKSVVQPLRKPIIKRTTISIQHMFLFKYVFHWHEAFLALTLRMTLATALLRMHPFVRPGEVEREATPPIRSVIRRLQLSNETRLLQEYEPQRNILRSKHRIRTFGWFE